MRVPKFCCLILAIFFFFYSSSQPGGQVHNPGRFFLKSGQFSIPIYHFQFLDSITPSRKKIYIIRFDITPGDLKTSQASAANFVDSIFASLLKKKTLSCIITSTDFDYNILRETEYIGALVSEIALDNLDGASKDALYIHIAFSSGAVTTKNLTGQFNARFNNHQAQCLRSHFVFSLGDLPCQRINAI